MRRINGGLPRGSPLGLFIGSGSPNKLRSELECQENGFHGAVLLAPGFTNRKLRGWANYFCLGPASKAYRAVDSHTRYRLRLWLCGKHKTAGAGTGAYPDEYLYEKLGLIRLEKLTAKLPWAKA